MATDPASLIANQQQFALDQLASANSTLSKLDQLTSSHFSAQSNATVAEPVIDFTEAELQQTLLGLFPGDLSVNDISALAPSFTPDSIDALPDVTVADFTKVAPTLEIPAAPSAVLPDAPAAPLVSDPILPSAPVLTLPVLPVLGAITLPDVPSIELPVMTALLPADDLVTPTNNFTFNEEAYQSALLDAATAKLLSDMENGGYGIEPADEVALFDRARTRELELAMQESEALLAETASRGWPVPPGDMTIALQRAQQNLANKLSGVNREITLERSRLFVENRRFTIEQVRQLETVLIGYHNSVMERSLNAAKAVLDASIKIFEAEQARAQLRLERYKADAAVFAERIRAAGLQVDIYRTTMEGKRIESEIQRTQVEVYTAQVRGVQLLEEIYKTQIEAARVQVEIAGLRIQAFRELVNAFTAQVQAKDAEFRMFESRIKGEVAKMQAFESEVRAYTATVEGARTKADILIARLKGQIEAANQKIEVFRAQIEQYKTDIGAQAQTIDARVRVHGAKVQGASAEAQALAQIHNLGVEKARLQLQARVEAARVAIEDAKTLLQGLVASADANVRAGTASAGYYQALIGAAVNSINTLSALINQ